MRLRLRAERRDPAVAQGEIGRFGYHTAPLKLLSPVIVDLAQVSRLSPKVMTGDQSGLIGGI